MTLALGNVIRLRERIWRVDRVDEHEFAATPLDGRDTRRWRFLRALEESRVAPGALPPPDTSVVSDPAQQDLLLRAYRLSLIHGSAPFLGLQRSRAIPEPYQLVPLLMALNMPAARLLIGDDVGVGKSVEAGLIASELIARGSAERLLVVVPAALREQWQETLSRFFHLEAVIMAGHTRPALERQLLPGQSPWDAFPVVVTSIDYVKKRIGEVLAHRWDIVLVDEAHLAQRPHDWTGAGNSSLQKDRWDFLEAVGQSAEIKHLLLLSATPHPGYTDCFGSLLQVLNPRAVSPGGTIQREVALRHVVQRRRKDIVKWYGGQNPFPKRETVDAVVPLTKAELALFEKLRAYAKTLTTLEGGNVGQWVSLHLQRRALSSPGAILTSLGERRKAALKRISAHTAAAAASEAEAESIVLDQDSTQDLDDETRFKRMDTAALAGTSEELQEVDRLIEAAKKVTAKQDGKLSRTLQALPELLKRHPKSPRVLIFTRYKDTLAYLAKALEKAADKEPALKGLAVFRIFGDMNQKDRRATYRTFETTERAVCVATDCISEGLDLQRGCAELIHYELPWNPNRLEQRNGRIDRYGQPEPKISILTLVREDALDIAILKVLVEKAGRIREAHGFCPVMFSSARELKRLIREFGDTRQTMLPGMELNDALPGVTADDSLEATEKERLSRIADESFYGQEEVRLPEVEQALQETYRTVGAPDEIKSFVLSALQRFHARANDQRDGTWKLDLRGTAFNDLGDELVITFDPKIARDDPELDLLDLAHPLVRRLVDTVQHELAGTEGGRVAARGSRDVQEVTAVLHILARFVTGSEPPVLMEELIPFAFLPYSGKLASGDALQLLRNAQQTHTFDAASLKEAAADTLAAANLDKLITDAVEERRLVLARRQAEIARMTTVWARGMDDVRVASKDLLTLTLLIPHG
jgi:superfamily II DNA or RNA helicase